MPFTERGTFLGIPREKKKEVPDGYNQEIEGLTQVLGRHQVLGKLTFIEQAVRVQRTGSVLTFERRIASGRFIPMNHLTEGKKGKVVVQTNNPFKTIIYRSK